MRSHECWVYLLRELVVLGPRSGAQSMSHEMSEESQCSGHMWDNRTLKNKFRELWATSGNAQGLLSALCLGVLLEVIGEHGMFKCLNVTLSDFLYYLSSWPCVSRTRILMCL